MSIEDRGIQDPFLNTLRRERIPVSMYLVNGIRLVGVVQSFDRYMVEIKGTATQMVFKHAISTIVPTRVAGIGTAHGNDGREPPADTAPPAAEEPKVTPVTIKRSRLRTAS